MGGHPILFLSREKMKNFIFCKNNRLQNRPDFENTSPNESHYGFALNSTNLSPMTNSESQRYHYPICHTGVAIHHPLSRFQSSARGPALSPTRSPMSLYVGSRALSSKRQKLFTPCSDKPDQTPPFSSLRSKQSQAFWPIASRSSLCEFLSLSPGHEASSYNSA